MADFFQCIAFQFHQESRGDWQILVQAVDVGKERYRAAGMMERPPFDGVIFVVPSGNSQLDRSLAALEGLKSFLESWGLDLMHVPVVLQYNRRGQEDTVPVDQLESQLNPWGLLSFPADTGRGEGVRETLKAVLGLSINHLGEQQNRAPAKAPTQPKAPPPPRPQTPPPAQAQPQSPVAQDQTGPSPVVQSEPPENFDFGPPLPGTEIEAKTRLRSEAIFDELRPPLVVPIRIPRRLLRGSDGPVRILLEVEIED